MENNGVAFALVLSTRTVSRSEAVESLRVTSGSGSWLGKIGHILAMMAVGYGEMSDEDSPGLI